MDSKGRSLEWNYAPGASLDAVSAGDVGIVDGGYSTFFNEIIGAHPDGIVYTIERIRGITLTLTATTTPSPPARPWIFQSLQLAPADVSDGIGTQALAVLPAGGQVENLESNRILWRHTGFIGQSSQGVPVGFPGNVHANYVDVDVKSKRRVDQANWSLVWVYTCETAFINLISSDFDIRLLLRNNAVLQ